MGESDPTASQPPKPVCDWSVGPRGVEVKDDFPTLVRHLQLAPNKPFIGQPVFPQAVDRTFSTGGKQPVDFSYPTVNAALIASQSFSDKARMSDKAGAGNRRARWKNSKLCVSRIRPSLT
jgi:hypothetical protein